MAKNELLPFADGEDANVLPTNQWEALTDILENGFQSGIARSEQVNRVLAQGAVASYVLGQLIVDQLNKNATLDKDTLYQNLVSALQENAKDACLPLSGGTLTGQLAVNDYLLIKSGYVLKGDTDGALYVMSGSGWANAGGYLTLAPRDDPKGANFQLTATDGSKSSQLKGEPGGSLTWDGRYVLQFMNPLIEAVVPTDGSEYVIPWDAIMFVTCDRNASGAGVLKLYLNGCPLWDLVSDNYANANLSFPVKKGQVFKAVHSENPLSASWAKIVAIGG